MNSAKQVHNLILDFLYKNICRGKTNQEIFRLLESTTMPPMTNDELEAIRLRFKEKELANPERMAEFRRRLKV
jgi:hypothetical protein